MYASPEAHNVVPISVQVHHYIFIIAQLWLTSHPRSTVVVLDTGTPGTSRGIVSEKISLQPLYFSDEKSTTVEQ